MNREPWNSIFSHYSIENHDFSASPFELSAEQIKIATRNFHKTVEREVRVLCKQDHREDRPDIFVRLGLFILPISNGKYAIVRGEGYVDIPPIQTAVQTHASALDFEPETSQVGDSEMQHLDYAYAASIIRDFMSDQTLILTIRGRKYTPRFEFYAGDYRHRITVHGVQTEVDAGYEGKNQVVLIEAKNAPSSNVIIRQLYYPFRQWMAHTRKPVKIVFFEKKDGEYRLWEFGFSDPEDYHSIQLTRSGKYVVV